MGNAGSVGVTVASGRWVKEGMGVKTKEVAGGVTMGVTVAAGWEEHPLNNKIKINNVFFECIS